MNEPVPGPNQARPPARPPRISLPVAIIGFAGAVALALVLIALILATDPGRAAAVSTASTSHSSSPTNLAVAPPSAEPTSRPSDDRSAPSPSAAAGTPTSSTSPPAYPVAGQADPPLMAAGREGSAYVAIREGDSVVLGSFAPDGTVRRGWPVRLHTRWCTQLVVARDGSVRVACEPFTDGSEGGLEPPSMRIFAIDSSGQSMPGWPVDIEGGSTIAAIDNDVAVVIQPYEGDAPPDGTIGKAYLGMVAVDGHAQMGTLQLPVPCCESTLVAGPRGGYLTTRWQSGDARFTTITAFGLRESWWSIDIEGAASDPAFDEFGDAHLAVWTDEPTSRNQVLTIDSDGDINGTSVATTLRPTSGWTGAGQEYPMPPTVGGGDVFVLGATDGTRIQGFGSDGSHFATPFITPTAVAVQGHCSRQDVGCGVHVVAPLRHPTGTLFVALGADRSTSGGSLVAINRYSDVIDGWPIGLKRPGAQFWQLAQGFEGGVWALAAEPDTDGYDVTLLSIASDSTIRGKVTVVEAALIGP
jgi:hypothetical protein